MSSLLGALSISLSALSADQVEVDVTSNNLANANTTGYARRQVILQEQPALASGILGDIGGGVAATSVESVRDPLLDSRVQQETQQQSASQEIVSAMQPVQTLFTTGNGGVSDAMTAFFSSLQSLSTSPTDSTLRATVLTDANNLAGAFQNTASQLTSAQQNLDLGVTQTVGQVNQLTTQLAQVNHQLTTAQASGLSGNDLEDQQQNLMSQLSGLIGFSVTQSSEGLTLTTANGAPLVVGGESFALSTAVNSSTGFQDVLSAQGQDITSEISAGQLGGIIQARDGNIASILSGLNTLASSFSAAINKVNMAGYDANGKAGQAMFSVTAGSGAAQSMSVALADPSQIAASSTPPTTTAGSSPTPSDDNNNLLAMINVGEQPLVNSDTPTQYLSGMVFQVGNDVSQAQSESDASSLMLQQLQDEQGSVEGVSTDEEASNLITYQRAYQAAAQVVSVVNELTLASINLGVEAAMT
jgi:flagellar hook-associated protein 1 FlgK